MKDKNDELSCTLRLLALTALRGLPNKEKITLMGLAGFDRHHIAELVGTTPLTVSVTLSNLRRKSRKQLGRAKK